MQRTMLAMLVGCALLTGAGCAKQAPPAEQALVMAIAEESTQGTTALPEAKPVLTLASASTTPVPDRALPARPISFDAIKFNIAVGQPFERAMLTPQIEKLLGKRIRIRGFIHRFSLIQQVGSEFVLVRDSGECCYGPGAAIYDSIRVHLIPGQSTCYTTNPIAVEGVLSLEEVPDPVTGDLLSLYRLDAEVAQ